TSTPTATTSSRNASPTTSTETCSPRIPSGTTSTGISSTRRPLRRTSSTSGPAPSSSTRRSTTRTRARSRWRGRTPTRATDGAAIKGGVPALPRALLLDLDDTILDDSSGVIDCWRGACNAHADQLGSVAPAALFDAIQTASEEYWSDPERHRVGRLDLPKARHEVVARALRALGRDAPDVALRISTAYAAARHERMRPFEDAIDTVRWFRERGCMLALLTNGAHEAQRSKIDRFELEGLFDAILIEGALGYGKPDPRVYRHALDALGVAATDTWM